YGVDRRPERHLRSQIILDAHAVERNAVLDLAAARGNEVLTAARVTCPGLQSRQHAWRRRGEPERIPAVDRKVYRLARVDHLAESRIVGSDGRRFGLYNDALCDLANFQREIRADDL